MADLSRDLKVFGPPGLFQQRLSMMRKDKELSSTQEIQQRKLELKARRKPLFDWYEKNPNDTSLVLEIKLVDDEIAKCNLQIERVRASRN
jgi:hypothetical protein